MDRDMIFVSQAERWSGLPEKKFLSWLQGRQVVEEKIVAEFYVFPSTEEEVRRNEFLWRAVRDSSCSVADIQSISGSGLLWMNVPKDLTHFLRSVDLDSMKKCILDVLSSVLELEEMSNLEFMQDLISPSLWRDLPHYLERKSKGEPLEPQSILLDEIIERNFGDCELDDEDGTKNWVVEIPGARYFDEAPVNILESARLGRIYSDWVHFQLMLCTRLGKSKIVASKCLGSVIRKKNRREVMGKIHSLRKWSSDGIGSIGTLPVELVDDCLVPNVLLALCSDDASSMTLSLSRQNSAERKLKKSFVVGSLEKAPATPDV